MAKHYFPTDFKDVVQNFAFPRKFNDFFARISKTKGLPNLKLLHKLLCMKLFVGADQITNRKILWHILSKRKRETVLNNKKVTKKSLYSTSAKIFRLRCRSEILITRTAFKWAIKLIRKPTYKNVLMFYLSIFLIKYFNV